MLNRILLEIIRKLKRIHVLGGEAQEMAEIISTLQAIIDVCKDNGEEKHDEDHTEHGKNV